MTWRNWIQAFNVLKVTFALGALSAASLQANFNGTLEIGADALYYKPYVEPFQFAEAFFSPADGVFLRQKVYTVNPRWSWGERVFARYEAPCCLWDAELSWTNLCTHHKRRVSADDLQIFVLINSGEEFTQQVDPVFGRFKTHYTKVNLRLGYCLVGGQCWQLRAFAGARYIDLHLSRFAKGILTTGNTLTVTGGSSFEGLGAEVGISFKQQICGCLTLAAEGALTGATGNRRFQYGMRGFLIAGDRVNTNYTTRLRLGCVVGALGRLSAAVCRRFSCGPCRSLVLRARVGIDFETFDRVFLVTRQGSSVIQLFETDAVFAGPFAGLSIGF